MIHIKTLLTACFAAAALTSTLAATPAYAWVESNQAVTTTVDIRDLQTDGGIAKVHDQLTRKAKRACSDSGQQSLQSRQSAKSCAQEMLAKFVEDLDHEKLNEYHALVIKKA